MILPARQDHPIYFNGLPARKTIVNYIQKHFAEFVPGGDPDFERDDTLDIVQGRVRGILVQRLPLLDFYIEEVRRARSPS